MRPCIQYGLLGLAFGFLSVAYGQDPADLQQLSEAVATGGFSLPDVLELAKLLGWPISFAYLFYSTAERTVKKFTAAIDSLVTNTEKIRKHTAKLASEKDAVEEEDK